LNFLRPYYCDSGFGPRLITVNEDRAKGKEAGGYVDEFQVG
jgi:hypothetical protein